MQQLTMLQLIPGDPWEGAKHGQFDHAAHVFCVLDRVIQVLKKDDSPKSDGETNATRHCNVERNIGTDRDIRCARRINDRDVVGPPFLISEQTCICGLPPRYALVERSNLALDILNLAGPSRSRK